MVTGHGQVPEPDSLQNCTLQFTIEIEIQFSVHGVHNAKEESFSDVKWNRSTKMRPRLDKAPQLQHEAADRVDAALLAIAGPTHDLEPMELGEKAFSSRARLYIGNLAPMITEAGVKEMLEPYGQVGECYLNRERRFAFVRMETRSAAVRAKRELNGKCSSGDGGGKYLIYVRFAPSPSAVKVSGLSPFVTNELLAKAFSVFGPIERCLVYVDSHGRSKEEGIVVYEHKTSAEYCVLRCTEQCFFLTATTKPVEVELAQNHEDEDGFMEAIAPKMHKEYLADRQRGPRLVGNGSFENEFGKKWKELRAAKIEQMEALEREFKFKEERLIASLECSKYAFETDILRKELMTREANLQRTLMKMTPESHTEIPSRY